MVLQQYELELWKVELEEAEKRLQAAVRHDNYGDKEWYTEKIRWAKHKIAILEGLKVV